MGDLKDELKAAGFTGGARGAGRGGPPPSGKHGKPGTGQPPECPGCRRRLDRHGLCDDCRDCRRRGEELLASDAYPDYYDQDGVLKLEYIDDYANCLALVFMNSFSNAQMRSFYSHVRRCEASWDGGAGKPLAGVRVELQKLKPHAHRQLDRGRISDSFKQFIFKNLDKVQDEAGLIGFTKHFEAVVAYSAGRLKERE